MHWNCTILIRRLYCLLLRTEGAHCLCIQEGYSKIFGHNEVNSQYQLDFANSFNITIIHIYVLITDEKEEVADSFYGQVYSGMGKT